MRECHPDYFPGDQQKAEQAKALNAAYGLLQEMAKDGRAQTFAAMAERERRTGSDDALSEQALFVVLVIMAPAGAGKTLGWVEWVAGCAVRRPAVLVRDAVLHVILASPTIALIEQTAKELAARGLSAPAVTVMHRDNVKGSVTQAIRLYFYGIAADEEAVLLCSHQAVFDNPLPPAPQHWDIVFDEMPDC